jgi:hypothetical protein
VALPNLQSWSVAHRDRETQEWRALHHFLLRLFALLGDVPEPGAVQRIRRCGAEYRDADCDLAPDPTEVEPEEVLPGSARFPVLARTRFFVMEDSVGFSWTRMLPALCLGQAASFCGVFDRSVQHHLL